MHHPSESLWVFGHRIRPMGTDTHYGMIEIASPPGVPGPPPHSHATENEFFLIMHGSLDVVRDGQWQQLHAGDYIDLPPGTVHTFINRGTQDTVWVTGWRPKGFERFFTEFGIPDRADDARVRSLAPDMLQRAGEAFSRYGMVLPHAPVA